MDNFKAPKSFLNCFKQEFGISGSKLTTLVTKNNAHNFKSRENNAIKSLLKVRDEIERIPQ